VTNQGVVKLLNFGVAKLLNPEGSSKTTGSTAASLRPMTPEYASPEQVRGSVITPGQRHLFSGGAAVRIADRASGLTTSGV
jgi:serine/threonine protein kinase